MNKNGFIIINLLLSSNILYPLMYVGLLLLSSIVPIISFDFIILILILSFVILFISKLCFLNIFYKYSPENSWTHILLDKIKDNKPFRFKFLLFILCLDFLGIIVLPAVACLYNFIEPKTIRYLSLLHKYVLIYPFFLGGIFFSYIFFLISSWIKTDGFKRLVKRIKKIVSRIWPGNKCIDVLIFIIINLVLSSNILYALFAYALILILIPPCPCKIICSLWVFSFLVISILGFLFIIFPIIKLLIFHFLYKFLPKTSLTYLLLDKIRHNKSFRTTFLLFIVLLDICLFFIEPYIVINKQSEVYMTALYMYFIVYCLLLGGVFISYISFLSIQWLISKFTRSSN